jgi:hypothetical protein
VYWQVVLDQYISEGRVSVSSTHVVEGGRIDSECKKTIFFNQ